MNDRQRLTTTDRRALAATAIQFFVNGAMTASFVARAPQLRDQIGVSVEGFGLLVTISSVIGLLASAVAGRIIHAAGTRNVLRGAGLAMSGALLIIGGADEPAMWLVGMFVYVFFDVLVDISMNLQGSWISGRRHAPVMNRLHGLWSLGGFTGGLGAVAANAIGLSPFTHLAIVGAMFAMVVVVAGKFLLATDEEHSLADANPEVRQPAKWRLPTLPVALLVAAGMFAVTAESIGGDWSTFRLIDDFGASSEIGSLAFAAFAVGMTTMRFAGDVLQHRLGVVSLYRASIAVCTTGFVVATLIPSQPVSILGFAMVGAGAATFVPKLYDDAARLPGRRGAGLGALTAGLRIAFLVSPVLVGSIAGTSLSVGQAIAVTAIPSMIGLAVVSEWNERLIRARRASS